MNPQELSFLVMLNTIGMSVLVENLKSASFIYTRSNKLPKHTEASFAFIKGTGLEMCINYYHMDYNADKIRNEFFSIFKDRKNIE